MLGTVVINVILWSPVHACALRQSAWAPLALRAPLPSTPTACMLVDAAFHSAYKYSLSSCVRHCGGGVGAVMKVTPCPQRKLSFTGMGRQTPRLMVTWTLEGMEVAGHNFK